MSIENTPQQQDLPASHQHNHCISKAKTRFVERLREMGKAIGTNDEPVLNLLLSNHRIFSAYDIAERISKMGKRVQPVQIYRSLEKLMALGLVHRLSTKNGFIACYEEGECATGQFLICTECESVKEIDSQLINREIHDSAQENSFSIGSKSIEVLGVCGNCQDN
tara:strand:- start:172 stop:666 length:495 start_codon:yes stop_codon:yes gene_type:complete